MNPPGDAAEQGTVERRLIPGQPCCCGDSAHADRDRWQWVASKDGVNATGDTPEQAAKFLQMVLDCRSEGRFLTVNEMVAHL